LCNFTKRTQIPNGWHGQAQLDRGFVKTNPKLSEAKSSEALAKEDKPKSRFFNRKTPMCKTNPIDTPRCRSGHRAGSQFVLPNEPKWNLAIVKLQNKPNCVAQPPSAVINVGEASVLHNIENDKTNPIIL
jgi:hypothetical protein